MRHYDTYPAPSYDIIQKDLLNVIPAKWSLGHSGGLIQQGK